MAYRKIKWKDHVVSRPRTYTETVNEDGTKTFLPQYGTIYQLGTQLNAENFNKTEDGLQHYAVVVDWLANILNALEMKAHKIIANQNNENLVMNAWFTINQRAKESYTGAGYTYDRWRMSANGILSVSDGILSFGSTTEEPATLVNGVTEFSYAKNAGKKYTASICFEGGASTLIKKCTFTVPEEQTAERVLLASVEAIADAQINIYAESSASPDVLLFEIKALAIQPVAVKLEAGTVCTLANESAPKYDEELLRCQRFYIPFNSASSLYWACYRFNNTGLRSTIPLPTKMRSAPVFISAESTHKWSVSQADTNSIYEVNGTPEITYVDIGYVTFKFTVASSAPKAIAIHSIGDFALSADL